MAQIKNIAASKVAPVSSDSDASVRVTHKNKARSGFLSDQNQQDNKTPNHRFAQYYYVLINNTGMPERKYKPHSSEKLRW